MNELTHFHVIVETNEGKVDWQSLEKKIKEAVNSEPHLLFVKIEDGVIPSRFIVVEDDPNLR